MPVITSKRVLQKCRVSKNVMTSRSNPCMNERMHVCMYVCMYVLVYVCAVVYSVYKNKYNSV